LHILILNRVSYWVVTGYIIIVPITWHIYITPHSVPQLLCMYMTVARMLPCH